MDVPCCPPGLLSQKQELYRWMNETSSLMLKPPKSWYTWCLLKKNTTNPRGPEERGHSYSNFTPLQIHRGVCCNVPQQILDPKDNGEGGWIALTRTTTECQKKHENIKVTENLCLFGWSFFFKQKKVELCNFIIHTRTYRIIRDWTYIYIYLLINSHQRKHSMTSSPRFSWFKHASTCFNSYNSLHLKMLNGKPVTLPQHFGCLLRLT